MRNEPWDIGSFPPMTIAAGFAVVALLGTLAWQVANFWRVSEVSVASNQVRLGETSGATSESLFNWQRPPESAGSAEGALSGPGDPDGLSNIGENVLGTLVGSYVLMKESGTYTPSAAEGVTATISADLRANISYRVYTVEDIVTDEDTSLSRALAYRNDLRIALEPLLKDSTYELELFAQYLVGGADALGELSEKIESYRLAAENATRVVVPSDATTYHIGILNALSEFETTLTQMVSYANDPFASAALLRTFNDAEMNMLTSFSALAGYFREHIHS